MSATSSALFLSFSSCWVQRVSRMAHTEARQVTVPAMMSGTRSFRLSERWWFILREPPPWWIALTTASMRAALRCRAIMCIAIWDAASEDALRFNVKFYAGRMVHLRALPSNSRSGPTGSRSRTLRTCIRISLCFGEVVSIQIDERGGVMA
jgi:hypothetical protein